MHIDEPEDEAHMIDTHGDHVKSTGILLSGDSSEKSSSKKTPTPTKTKDSFDGIKEKRAWDFATSPAKQLPMQAFMLYMSGGGVQIFSMGIVFMLLMTPFKNVFAMNEGTLASSRLVPVPVAHQVSPKHHSKPAHSNQIHSIRTIRTIFKQRSQSNIDTRHAETAIHRVQPLDAGGWTMEVSVDGATAYGVGGLASVRDERAVQPSKVKLSGGTFTLDSLPPSPLSRKRRPSHPERKPPLNRIVDGDDDDPREGLWVSAKRYSTEDSVKDTKGLTLLFTHCNGSSKEEWDIVISNLFKIQSSKDEPFRIREAWSFDRQNHGDAAVLNARALDGRKEGVSLYEWALALTWFVRSPLLYGHRLVPFGHSAGTSAWMLTTTHFALDSIPYVSMFLVESTITPKDIFETELEERLSYMDLVVNLTLKRRDDWPNKEAALEYFGKRLPWSLWDPRALKYFVVSYVVTPNSRTPNYHYIHLFEHGLHDAPDTRRGVTLKWTKEQEASSYPDRVPHYESAVRLAEVSNVIPVHLIWGERVEFMRVSSSYLFREILTCYHRPEYLRDALSDKSAGMNVASVSYIEDAGHMVVQEKPDTLATIIAAKLDSTVPIPPAKPRIPQSKL
ncbi:hypothetical protein NMY22_g3252 [Coprinellus aureogranulatus]|nr:hypothetical protein NMY22_g3252 [Coprinellus aureogranulatus]